jgi:hypothetical protein
LAEQIAPSELLESALSSLSPPDPAHRAVYKRGICLIAGRVRHAHKIANDEPRRAELRNALQRVQQDAGRILQALENPQIVKALQFVGYREPAVERAKHCVHELSEALSESTRALRLNGRGSRRAWDFMEASPKELLLLLGGKLFKHVRAMEKQPYEEREFHDFIAPVWELATGEGAQDFGRQVDNTKEVIPANLGARLEGGDLVRRLEKALLRRRRTPFAGLKANTVRSSRSTPD